MYLVLFVLDDPARLDELLSAWEAQGVSGATIIESTGMGRRRGVEVPMRFLFGAAGDYLEEGHVTLLALVSDAAVAGRCLAAAESLVGDLNEPHTGIFAAWPLDIAKGLREKHA